MFLLALLAWPVWRIHFRQTVHFIFAGEPKTVNSACGAEGELKSLVGRERAEVYPRLKQSVPRPNINTTARN